ncbi:MAG: hypothetical protein IPP77_11290 [Bacteroidetes bacterium]|nr:hypothetical protein [Bacteroidota bacterium]
MDEFKLSGQEVYQILKKKGVRYMHHSNTVATSITFIQNRALLTRHFVESEGLYQTPQKSDPEDKKFDVWDSVFLDGEDLHNRYSRANKYGPVLFKFKLELLVSPSIKEVYITKTNPWYWKNTTSLENKYYKSTVDLNRDYLTGRSLDSQIMFTVRSPGTEIKLNKFLHSIVLDIPKLLIKTRSREEMLVGDYGFKAIQNTLSSHGLGHVPLIKRHDGRLALCRCITEYNYLHSFNKQELKKRFAMADIPPDCASL